MCLQYSTSEATHKSFRHKTTFMCSMYCTVEYTEYVKAFTAVWAHGMTFVHHKKSRVEKNKLFPSSCLPIGPSPPFWWNCVLRKTEILPNRHWLWLLLFLILINCFFRTENSVLLRVCGGEEREETKLSCSSFLFRFPKWDHISSYIRRKPRASDRALNL